MADSTPLLDAGGGGGGGGGGGRGRARPWLAGLLGTAAIGVGVLCGAALVRRRGQPQVRAHPASSREGQEGDYERQVGAFAGSPPKSTFRVGNASAMFECGEICQNLQDAASVYHEFGEALEKLAEKAENDKGAFGEAFEFFQGAMKTSLKTNTFKAVVGHGTTLLVKGLLTGEALGLMVKLGEDYEQDQFRDQVIDALDSIQRLNQHMQQELHELRNQVLAQKVLILTKPFQQWLDGYDSEFLKQPSLSLQERQKNYLAFIGDNSEQVDQAISSLREGFAALINALMGTSLGQVDKPLLTDIASVHEDLCPDQVVAFGVYFKGILAKASAAYCTIERARSAVWSDGSSCTTTWNVDRFADLAQAFSEEGGHDFGIPKSRIQKCMLSFPEDGVPYAAWESVGYFSAVLGTANQWDEWLHYPTIESHLDRESWWWTKSFAHQVKTFRIPLEELRQQSKLCPGGWAYPNFLYFSNPQLGHNSKIKDDNGTDYRRFARFQCSPKPFLPWPLVKHACVSSSSESTEQIVSRIQEELDDFSEDQLEKTCPSDAEQYCEFFAGDAGSTNFGTSFQVTPYSSGDSDDSIICQCDVGCTCSFPLTADTHECKHQVHLTFRFFAIKYVTLNNYQRSWRFPFKWPLF